MAATTSATAPPTNAAAPSGTTTSKTATTVSSTAPAAVDSTLPELLAADVYGYFVLIFMSVLSIFVLFATGSILSVLVLWAVAALMVTVLVYYGFVDISSIFKKKPVTPPVTPQASGGSPLVGSEVFHIQQNQFTYDEAPAVCAAYDAELATLEQIIDAYNHGAEWCGYGWSAGGMALYPTQKKTWEELQREIDPGKRTRCGRPGVNGGYMDPMLKLGVNCFGFKPKGDGKFKGPTPIPGTDQDKFDEMVGRFKEMLNTMKMSSFSRKEWSGYDSTLGGAVKSTVEKFWGGSQRTEIPAYTQSFATPQGFVEGFENGDAAFAEAPTTSSYSAGPFGLRGDVGATGPTGPIGITGAKGDKGDKGDIGSQGVRGLQGPVGAASTVPGPRGLTGPAGPAGPRGLQGIAGTAAAAGATGPRGLTGPAGPAGPKGDKGAQGDRGVAGAGVDPSLVATVNDLKANAVRKDKPFRIQDGQGQYLSKNGGGGPYGFEVLNFKPV